MNLFETLMNADNGRMMELLARQFELSRQQAELAVEALLPALGEGIRRRTADPFGFSALMTALASGQYAPYFEEAAKAFSPEGVKQGKAATDWLFGSPALSEAVAAQAAQATGIGQKALEQMLPVLAAMTIGALAKQSAEQMREAQAAAFGADNPFVKMFQDAMKQGGTATAPKTAPGGPFDPLGANPFLKAWQEMLAGSGQSSGKTHAEGLYNPFASASFANNPNPWAEMFREMAAGAQSPGTGPERDEGGSGKSETPSTPYDEFFGRMFDTGRQMQADYAKQMAALFDQFGKGAKA